MGRSRPLFVAAVCTLIGAAMCLSVLPTVVRADDTEDEEPLIECTEEETVSLSMAPHRLVLNAVGQSEVVQAIIPAPPGLADGYDINSFELELFIKDVLTDKYVKIDDADAVDYCAVDDNLFVYFYRTEVLGNLDSSGIEGSTDAMVNGLYITTDGAEHNICGIDPVDILAPGNNPGN